MKLILFIQTLIIIAGGYYVYLITKEPVKEVIVEEEMVMPATTTPVTEVETTVESESTAEDVSDNHDQGMEWPTLENESDIQVR